VNEKRDVTEIEVTPEMVEAAMAALRTHKWITDPLHISDEIMAGVLQAALSVRGAKSV
jgi:hypothetical protein